jgi:hypothetical protein
MLVIDNHMITILLRYGDRPVSFSVVSGFGKGEEGRGEECPVLEIRIGLADQDGRGRGGLLFGIGQDVAQ